MSIITIRVHHRGEFVEDGEVTEYVGGEVDQYLQDTDLLSPFDFIRNLDKSKYAATNVWIWYCPPNEPLATGKRLLSKDDDVRDFILAAHRSETKSIDVYVEHDVDDVILPQENDLGDEVDDGMEYNIEGSDDDVEGSSSSNEGCGSFELCESSSSLETLDLTFDEEIESNWTNAPGVSIHLDSGVQHALVDEDKITDDEDPLTEDDSEGEFEIDRYRMQNFTAYNPNVPPSDIRFSLWQTFKDADEFRDALIEYSIASHRDIRFERSNKIKVCAVCVDKKCSWRIWCSYDKKVRKFQVKSFNGDHICEQLDNVRMCNTNWLTKKFMGKFRSNPSYKAKHLRLNCLNTYGMRVSLNKCWRARYACLRQLQGNQKEHFAKLRNYKLELERANPDSIITIDLDKADPQNPIFKRMYIGFGALKRAWRENCHPIIGLDGCFLKWFVKGELLCAVGRDANNQMYPIAWAVVEVENTSSWEWFIKLLIKDLGFPQGAGLTIMSDGQKGLDSAMRTLMPHAKHRLCTRHVYSNWKKKHKMPELRHLFWQVAKAFTENEVTDVLEQIEKLASLACQYLKNSNMSAWSQAFFDSSCQSDVVQNNLSESFNSSVRDARTKPIIDMFEDIRRGIMVRIAEKKSSIAEWPGTITPRIQELIDRSLKKSFLCNVMCNGNFIYEVVLGDDVRAVDMNKKACSCRAWEVTSIPCFHALAVIKHRNEKICDHVSAYYKKETWEKCYKYVLNPINGVKSWPRSQDPVILPPNDRVMPRRPKRNRIKDPSESPKKKGKATRYGRVMTCQYCLGQGHNSTGCQKRQNGEPRAPRLEAMRKPKGRPRSAQPRSSMKSRNRQRGGSSRPSTWNTQANSEERMFREGYGVYQDHRTGELMRQSGTNRYAADGSVSSSVPSCSCLPQSSQPNTTSQPLPESQPTSSSQPSSS